MRGSIDKAEKLYSGSLDTQYLLGSITTVVKVDTMQIVKGFLKTCSSYAVHEIGT